MVFDLVSFLAGIIAGGLTGVLAGILYSFERTADLQESLLKLRKEINSVYSTVTAASKPMNADSEKTMRQLRADLDSIHEEIRRMYRRTAS
jgi:archaellum component FlaC